MLNLITNNIPNKNYSISKQAMNSYLAGLIGGVVSLPLWTLRLRISQISYSKSENIQNGTKLIKLLISECFSSKKNIIGLFSGFVPTLFLSFYPAIQMTMYQQIKNISKEEDFRNYISTFAGSLSQFVTSLIMFPLNFIKAKQQQLSIVKNELLNKNLYENNFQEDKYKKFTLAIKSIWEEHGMLGFYRGCTPLLFRNVIRGGIFFYFYENTNFILQKK